MALRCTDQKPGVSAGKVNTRAVCQICMPRQMSAPHNKWLVGYFKKKKKKKSHQVFKVKKGEFNSGFFIEI